MSHLGTLIIISQKAGCQMAFSIWPAPRTLTFSIADKLVVSVVDLVDRAVMMALITDPEPLPSQQVLSLPSAWSLSMRVPAGPRRSGTSTTPSPGSVRPLCTAAAVGIRTTSWRQRTAWRPAVVMSGPSSKKGDRTGREGKGWEKEVELRGPHTIHTCTVSFLLAASQEKGLPCPVKPHTEHILHGPAWQKVTLEAPSWESEPPHMLPFSQMGTLSQPPHRAGLQSSWTPHLGLETHFLLVGHSGPGWTVVACFWESRGSVKVSGVQVWCLREVNQQVSFFLQRTFELYHPETLKSKEDAHRAGLRLLLKQLDLLWVLLNPTLLSRTLPLSFPPWVYMP